MQIVLLTTDLMLISAAQGVASRRSATLVVASTPDAAPATCGESRASLLIIDLRTPGLDVGALVAAVRQAAAASIHIMACGPHVHEASLAAAGAAGCDEVVTRGEFDRRLDIALARLMGG